MTDIILSFPVRRTARLSCIWIETGNPAQPLICKWITPQQSGADHIKTAALHNVRLCA